MFRNQKADHVGRHGLRNSCPLSLIHLLATTKDINL